MDSENFFSRQVGTYGSDMMKKIPKISVFLSGLRGLGAEISKNIILSGIHNLTIHDNSIATIEDLSSSFCIAEEDAGQKTRAQASYNKLKELNPSINLEIFTKEIELLDVTQYTIIVITESDFVKIKTISESCHRHNIAFISAENWGAICYAFVDFGPKFTIFDQLGLTYEDIYISNITVADPAVVTIVGTHNLTQDNYLVFSEIEGMVELNNQEPLKILNVIDENHFEIQSTLNFSSYIKGGVAKVVQVPIKRNYSSFKQCYKDPTINNEIHFRDFTKPGRKSMIQLLVLTLLRFSKKEKRMPRLMNELDSRICVRTANRINKRLKIANKIDEELIKKLVKYSKIQICAIVSIWGGIIAQEILKITGKYLSIFQWAYLDFSELLINSSIPKQVDRYFGIKLFIGEEAFQILQNKKTLIVGAGALGCELIKHLAVLGVSKNTPVVVTDNDSIELSNLSRQFLFRRENIGQSKSKTAVNAALQINPAAKMQAYDKKVCQSSESFFMDEFWDSLDVVFLAVDNIEARNYVDSKCVNHKKMLLESGTLGMQASSQTIIPFQTLTYRDIPRGTTKSIPMCTLKSFPYLVLHCIEWARDLFEEIFDVSLKVLNSFNSDPQSFCEELLIMSNMNLKYEKLCQLLNILFLRKIENKKKIIKGTCELFICYFRDNILDLIYHNPIDQKNIDGTLYWSGTKRFPIAANIDLSSECINFLHACCKIFMSSVNLSFEISELEIKEFILNYKSSDFKPRLFGQDEKIQEFVDNHIEKLINLPKVSKIFESVAFEKDDDSNYHIEFIVNASNIRAKSYKLEQTDRQNSKMIAGRIIPAIASTTSVVSGFVALEFIKSSIFKNITFFKNSSINLSIPIIRLMNPSKPLKLKDSEENESIYTVWDSIEILGPLTLEEFLAYFKEKYNSNVLSASIGEFVLYHFTMAKEYEFFMKSKIEDEYQTISGNKIDSWKKWIDIIVEIGKENNTERILLPIIRYKI